MDTITLARSRHFNSLAEQDQDMIEGAAIIRYIVPSSHMIRQEDQPESALFLLSGHAYRFSSLPGGQRQITALLIPGDNCNLHGCFTRRYHYGVRSITSCTVAEVPRRVILDWIETHPRIAHALWSSLIADQAILQEWLVCSGARTAIQRIAHLFCELLVRLRAVGLTSEDSFEFPLTQHELGEITGLSTVHVNRTLQTMRADGLIVLRGDQLTVLDSRRLQEMAEFDPSYLDTRE